MLLICTTLHARVLFVHCNRYLNNVDPPNILHIRLANVEAAEVACEQYLTFRDQALTTMAPAVDRNVGLKYLPGAFSLNDPGNNL